MEKFRKFRIVKLFFISISLCLLFWEPVKDINCNARFNDLANKNSIVELIRNHFKIQFEPSDVQISGLTAYGFGDYEKDPVMSYKFMVAGRYGGTALGDACGAVDFLQVRELKEKQSGG